MQKEESLSERVSRELRVEVPLRLDREGQVRSWGEGYWHIQLQVSTPYGSHGTR